MKYEIINPSDKCYITADNNLDAQIVGTLLGSGWYGVQSEYGDLILGVMQPLDEASGLSESEITQYIDSHAHKIFEVFQSFQYAADRTSMNDIGSLAKKYADALLRKEQNHD